MLINQLGLALVILLINVTSVTTKTVLVMTFMTSYRCVCLFIIKVIVIER